MPTGITITRNTSLFSDLDGDGQIDPGDSVQIIAHISNVGTEMALALALNDTFNGYSLNAGSVKITPIAVNDSFNITGNTPITITKASLLGNDIDPDGAEANITITGVSGVSAGSSLVDNGNGTLTFTPATGLNVGDTASFTYTITDEQGLVNATGGHGVVTLTITDVVWYVDNNYVGENGTPDGSYMKPYVNLLTLNGVTGDGTTNDDVDAAGETIFVYHNAVAYTAGVTLEAGQKLFGDGNAFLVNGHNIGGLERTGGVDDVATNSVINVANSTTGIVLSSDNQVKGLDLAGQGTGSIGIADGGGAISTGGNQLTIANVGLSGQGTLLDIDSGGKAVIGVNSLSSTGSSGSNGGVVDLTGLTSGSALTVAGTTTINGTHAQAGIDISNNSGVTVNFQGNVTVSTTVNNAVVIDNNAGTNSVTFGGTANTLTTTSGNALEMTGNTSAGTTVNLANGGLNIDTTVGTGLNVGATTLNVAGASNTIDTTAGQILIATNAATSGLTFATLTATNTTAGNAISINNLDGGAMTVSGNVTIANSTGDAINIIGGSSTNFAFNGTTAITTASGDGVELGATSGTVSFANLQVGNVAGNGLIVTNATNSVTVTAGTIGTSNVNDPALDAVNVTGGSGAVTIGASITKATGGGEIVDISGHATGAINITGALNASGGSGGIRLVDNTSGAINFTNAAVNLNTGALNAVTFTNTAATGAAVTFNGGNLNIDTVAGAGINATSTTAGAGSLTISGANNVIDTTGGGRAVTIDGVNQTVTLLHVSSTGGSGTAIFLQNAGSGGFTVTGTGTTDASGGILNFSAGGADGSTNQGIGVYLNNVGNISLSNMDFLGTFSNFGIRGDTVNNFTLQNSDLTGIFGTSNTTGIDEGTIRFGTQGSTTINGLTGTGSFLGNIISNGSHDNLGIFNGIAGTLNFNLTDTAAQQAVIGDTQGGVLGNIGVHIQTGGSGGGQGGGSNLTATITNVDFQGAHGDLLFIVANQHATQNLTITGNNFLNTDTNSVGGGVTLTSSAAADTNYVVDYNVSNNIFRGAWTGALNAVYKGAAGDVSGIIQGNTIGTPSNPAFQGGDGVDHALAISTRGSGQGNGIFVAVDRAGVAGTLTHAVRIQSNNIADLFQANGGIALRSNSPSAGGGAGRLEATLTSNTVGQLGAQALSALYGQLGGSGAGDTGRLGITGTGNVFDVTGSGAFAVVNIDQVNSVATAHFYIPGMVGTTSGAAAATAIQNRLVALGNTLNTGGGAIPVFAGEVINANGDPFVLPVPLMAVVPTIVPWEDDPANHVTLPAEQIPGQGGQAPVADGSGDPPIGEPGTGETGAHLPPAGGPTGGPAVVQFDPATPTVVDDGVVSQAELDLIVDAAIARWEGAGLTPEQLAAMRGVAVTVSDMSGLYVGSSAAGLIRVDSDGAGYGWFVDATPGEDSEFDGSGSRLTADAGGAAEHRIDLLTVVMHELGHQIGLDDSYASADAAELMYGFLNPSERRLPSAGDADGGIPGSLRGTDYVLGPVTNGIGDLPAGKSVDVIYTATVDTYQNQLIPGFTNSSAVSGGNFTTSPVTSSAEALAIDSLTLGNQIFIDVNANGLFDAGDTGVANVALTLYADSNGNGVLDGAETTNIITTAISNGSGIYSFAGLAPGDYVVSVDAANFTGGGPLVGKTIPSGATDPDDNVDNDSNSLPGPGGTAISDPIRLDYNQEPTAGTGNDTNNRLDFGFLNPNSPPVFTGLDGTPTFVEAGAAVVLDNNATVSDPNLTGTNYSGATLTLARSGGANTADSFGTTGTLSFSGANVQIGATVVGTFTQSAGTLVITFNSSATQALVNSTLQQLTYSNSNDNPTASVVIAYAFNDGNTGTQGSGGALTATGSVTVTITPTNDAPDAALSNPNLGPATEQTAFNLKNSGLSVSDVDGNNGSETVTLAVGTGVLDVFAGTSGAGVSGSGSDVVTITGTIAQINALLNTDGTSTVSFLHGSDTPPASASLTLIIHDNGNTGGGDLSDSDTGTITITAVNDAPQFSALDGTPTFTEAGAAVVLDANASVLDQELTGGNYDGATLTLARSGGASAQDVFDGTGGAGLTLSGGNASVNGTMVGTYTQSAGTLIITFNTSATQSLVDGALQGITYSNSSQNPPATAVIAYAFSDGNTGAQGTGGAGVANGSVTVSITPVDNGAVAVDDSAATPENATKNIVVLTNDSDVDGPQPSVALVDGQAIAVGGSVFLISGAKVTLEANGSLTYDPNGQFNTLTNPSSGEIGAVNTSAPDSFTYTLSGAGGGTATVSITVNGVATIQDHLEGDGGNNNITGTPIGDFFDLSQGGNDTATGLGANDGFFFGAAFTADDQVNGGDGVNDQVGLLGNYAGGNALVLGPNTISNVEAIVVLPGFSYNITTDNGNVAPGGILKVQATQLGLGQNLTFNGSAELDGSFIVYGGQGDDNMTGGNGNDGFYFGPGGFSSSDLVNGGPGGNDQLALDGSYGNFATAFELGGNVSNVEVTVLLPGPSGSPNSFNLTTNESFVATGTTMTIFGLQVGTDIAFDGSNEHDGAFRFYGGAGNDVFTGSTGNDWIFGGGGGDALIGGSGADTFFYDDASQSALFNFDRITGFDDSADKIDLSFAVTGFAGPASGNLSAGTFDSDLGGAFAGLASHQVGLFTATGGDMNGRTFLVIDANGATGYQAGSDFVIEFITPTTPIDNPAIFV